jgi:hypothetical protein
MHLLYYPIYKKDKNKGKMEEVEFTEDELRRLVDGLVQASDEPINFQTQSINKRNISRYRDQLPNMQECSSEIHKSGPPDINGLYQGLMKYSDGPRFIEAPFSTSHHSLYPVPRYDKVPFSSRHRSL